MKRLLSIYIVLLIAMSALADGIGKWTLYPSYRNITDVSFAGNDIFVVSSGNLFSYNKNDGSLQTYTKNDVLSDNGIKKIAWAKSVGKLLIAYESSIIDFLSLSGDVSTITDIADKTMTDDKSINNIYINGQYAYLSMGFGVLKINLKEEYIVDTYNLGVKVTDAAVKDGFIYALSESGVLKGKMTDNLLDKSRWQLVSEDWNSISPNKNKSNANGTLFLEASTGSYWGNNKDGKLTRYEEEGGEMVEKTTGVAPDGPYSNSFWRVYLHDGKLYGTAGIYSSGVTFELTQQPGLVHCYDKESGWTKLAEPYSVPTNPYKAANCMAFDPRDKNHFWVGAGSGLYEYKDGEVVNIYNQYNSPLVAAYNISTTECIICSMTYDNEDNLWIMCGWCDNTMICYTQAGEWKVYKQKEDDFNSLYNIDAQGVFYSKTNNFLWWCNNYWGKTAVFKYDTLNDVKTSFKNFINEDNNDLNMFYTNNITEDRKGNIWVATDVGPLYYSAEDIRGDMKTITQHKVPRNDGTNFADYLMDKISVKTIAVDAENRKWMGTTDMGIYVISDDCNTEVVHYDTNNSVLLSNTIYDITIDDNTGEVYIATDKGLCSYSTGVKSTNADMSKNTVWAYPNPVTPDYTGDVTIVGLSAEAKVTIMTTSGKLVNQGTANGGVYTWNCRDTSDNRVASGVYMVAVTDREGNKGFATKIAIVR